MQGGNPQRTGASPAIGTATSSYVFDALSTRSALYASVVYGLDGALIVASGDGSLTALTPDGVDLYYQYYPDAVFHSALYSTPAIGPDGTIYVGSSGGVFYALDGTTYPPTTKWTFTAPGPVNSSPVLGLNGTIYVGSDIGLLHALFPNGTLKWTAFQGLPVACTFCAPAVGPDGTVYMNSKSNAHLAALSPVDGSVLWTVPLLSSAFSSPVVSQDGSVIYVATSDGPGHLLAIAPNGTVMWRFATPSSIQSPAAAIGPDGVVYIGCNNAYMYAVYPNGTQKWAFHAHAAVGCAATVDANGVVYFGDDANYMYAVDSDGNAVWSYLSDSIAFWAPTIGQDGTVYFPEASGVLVAFPALGPVIMSR